MDTILLDRQLEAQIGPVITICDRAATGDLEARIDTVELDERLAPLGLAINRLLDVLDAYVRESSAMMASCSRDRYHRPILLRGLRGSFLRGATTINAAGRQMRENKAQIDMVAELARENTDNIMTVATAVEELGVTTAAISDQTGNAARIARETAHSSSETARSVEPLTQAVGRVNKIVNLISRVASQTNLLALNATIEAARAGHHGKGFAVVANEVKELSRSTAEATQEIRREVGQMQTMMDEVVRHIVGIHASLTRVEQSTGEIAHAVEEQVKATHEISSSISVVSRNTGMVSERIAGRVAP
ncbi:MAG: methyl-accepting chemotaxis protein [bacterium]|jgi:methyl-accepting chemotaxis protein|nr:methyl-accepting chemotaxis protein [bacterium]